jgi:ketosteroid isomerase-like protein
MNKFLLLMLAITVPLFSQATPPSPGMEELRQKVRATEQAFARSMAERDAAAFAGFISEEAVFFSGEGVLRGKAAVVAHWNRFFVEKAAPFSWGPESVEVLESGTLALTTGPVFDPAGKMFGTFTSIWRLEKDGRWRIIFDKGNPLPAK